eukprot:scaffold344_cov215-Prasinococcus_capsulatus_cf.AAC.1
MYFQGTHRPPLPLVRARVACLTPGNSSPPPPGFRRGISTAARPAPVAQQSRAGAEPSLPNSEEGWSPLLTANSTWRPRLLASRCSLSARPAAAALAPRQGPLTHRT